jgi:hypothetical protein
VRFFFFLTQKTYLPEQQPYQVLQRPFSMLVMDNAVALVQAYLRVNGYFTVAEYPVIEAVETGGYRAVTDLDILAFRFPHAGRLVPGARSRSQGKLFAPDPNLGVPGEHADLIIGEIKEGKAELNKGAQETNVMKVALRRFGCCDKRDSKAVDQLVSNGRATLASGNQVRLVAFGTSPPDVPEAKYEVILLRQITEFLDDYIRQYWRILKHGQFKDHGLGFLVTLEKVRRAAGQD